MVEEKIWNRWLVVVGGFLINLMLGVIYAWSVFIAPLETEFGWTRGQTSLTFTLVVAFFAVGMIPAGRWQDKHGPRKIAMIGGAILGVSWILASFTSSLGWLYVTYGVLGGFGIGMAYVTPVATGLKWFPDKRGVVTGLIVMGFGLGAAFLAPIAVKLIAMSGWRSAFLYMGGLFLVVCVGAAQLLREPPKGWTPEGWTPPTEEKDERKITVAHKEFTWQEMIKTPQFWMVWIMYCFTAASGLLVIGHLSPFAVKQGIDPIAASGAVGMLSIFNGAGRPGMGFISDITGRTRGMVLDFGALALIMAILIKMNTLAMLYVAVAVIGFFYGGILSLMPSITGDYFGTENAGMNYAVLFTAWGVAGMVGPGMAGFLYDATGSYATPFLVAAVLCAIAAGLAVIIKRPVAEDVVAAEPTT